ncbi:MAG TPA: 4'-phosphopantetheinyl transferase superfamily protein [Solirubrobacteraceae bacterium]|nr:4'-phosphopantetheinyl transferase superfamily protein [Solirubrobacteraceae bacterium]
MLRELLGRYLGRDPRELSFVTGEHGKPSLFESPYESRASRSIVQPYAELHFNLSHSGGLALYALTNLGPVGIDVEVHRRAINPLALARHVLDPSEIPRLEGLDATARQREFLRVWTRREAALKCRGMGLSNRVDGRDTPLWVKEGEVCGAAAMAIALHHEPREVTCWAWQD